MYIAYAFKSVKKYYFTGAGFDSAKASAKKYKNLGSLKIAIKKYVGKLPTGYGIKAEKISVKSAVKAGKKRGAKSKTTKKKPTKRAKNPVPLSRQAKIELAMKNYKAFTGHDPKYIDEIRLQNIDTAFKVGMCDGILYTTVRDGKTEKYIHKFKKRARPILASNYDGSEIRLVGGKYSFTDRGIVDN